MNNFFSPDSANINFFKFSIRLSLSNKRYIEIINPNTNLTKNEVNFIVVFKNVFINVLVKLDILFNKLGILLLI